MCENFTQIYLRFCRGRNNKVTYTSQSNACRKLQNAKAFRLPLTLRKNHRTVGYGWNYCKSQIEETKAKFYFKKGSKRSEMTKPKPLEPTVTSSKSGCSRKYLTQSVMT